MKNIYLIFYLIAFMAIAGCGDSRIRELRGQFIEGCKTNAPRNVCACIFEKIESNYSKDQILDIKIGILPKEFSEFTTKSAMQCTREN